MGSEWRWAALLPSLEPGSTAEYIGCCIRPLKPGYVRLHVPPEDEMNIVVTVGLTEWLDTLDTTFRSFTNTHYIPARYRLLVPQGVRMQVEGTPLNRPWGAEFDLGAKPAEA